MGIQLCSCSKEAGSGLSGRMCAITRDSREEADSQERPLRRGSFTSEKKVRTTAAVSSETRRARRFVPNAERKKKTNYHSSKSVHSEIVFKNGEIKALQTNRSWENQISVGLFYKKCESSPRRETSDWNWDPHRTLRSPGQVKIEVNIKGFFLCVWIIVKDNWLSLK